VARRALAGLEYVLDPGLFMDVSLCVSELVTSAIADAQPSAEQGLELRLSLSGGVLVVSVEDHEPGADGGERRAPPELDGDLGLHIISQLADRWGVDPDGARRWMEFSRLAGGARERSTAFGARPRI
jgi:two-component sensor histidine kinase